MNKSIVFFGCVHPERADFNISEIKTTITNPINQKKSEVCLRIDSSQIILRLTDDLELHIDTLRESLQNFVACIVDAVGFGVGCGYRVELISVSSQEISGTFGVKRSVINKKFGHDLNLDKEITHEVNKIVKIFLVENKAAPFLQQALADHRQAILDVRNSPFHCFRSVECLMYYFGRNNKDGRGKLCSALHIDSTWLLKKLEKRAAEIRHGKMRNIQPSEIDEAITSSRLIIWRFVELVTRRLTHLPQTDFPLIR